MHLDSFMILKKSELIVMYTLFYAIFNKYFMSPLFFLTFVNIVFASFCEFFLLENAVFYMCYISYEPQTMYPLGILLMYFRIWISSSLRSLISTTIDRYQHPRPDFHHRSWYRNSPTIKRSKIKDQRRSHAKHSLPPSLSLRYSP
jgi:hypothetical protein